MGVEAERSEVRAEDVSAAVRLLGECEREIELSSGATRYFEAGTGAPLLLLHGIGLTAGGTNWLLNIGELARHRRVIAPDFIGFGTGSRLQQPYSFAVLVDFVRELQDALGIDSADVVGHSMGGWVASLLAYESPDRVERLVLIAPGGMSTQVPRAMAVRRPSRARFADDVASRHGIAVTAVGALADLEWKVMGVPDVVEAYARLSAHMGDPETRRLHQLPRRLPKIRADALLLWGSEDRVNPLSMGRAMRDGLARAELEVLPCGHAVPTERPAETDRAILAFVGRQSH